MKRFNSLAIKVKHFLSSEFGFFVIITTLLMSISLAPTVKRYLTTPPDRVFDGLEYYSDDYSIYVANILQGQKGRWTLLDKHTTEPHQGTIIHDEYLLWGKFTGFFHIDQIKSYHLARLTFGIILLGMIYLLLKEVFSDKNRRKLAFFLITFSTGFPIFLRTVNPDALSFLGWQVKEHMDWLTEMDVFFRFVALPHYLLGNIFFVGALVCFLRYLKSNSQYLIFGAFCALMLALIHPVALVSLIALLSLYLLFSTIIKLVSLPKFYFRFKEYLFFIACLVASLPIMLYYRYLFTVPPWNHMAAWEGVTQYFVPLSEFAGAIGPTFYLGIIGFFAMLYRCVIPSEARNLTQNGMTRKGLVLFSWILSFFLLVYFSYPFLKISQVRFMQVFIFIPFGILATEGVLFLAHLVMLSLRGLAMTEKGILACFILSIALISLPVYYVSFLSKWYSYDSYSEVAYPYSKIYDGYQWLAKNTNPEDAVLTAFLAGTQIPYMSGNTVYVGHLWATLNRVEKEKLLYKFLGNKMGVEEAKNFFQNGHIKYFFDDYQAASYGINPQSYPFLKPVFKNEMVTIYLFSP